MPFEVYWNYRLLLNKLEEKEVMWTFFFVEDKQLFLINDVNKSALITSRDLHVIAMFPTRIENPFSTLIANVDTNCKYQQSLKVN